MSLGKVVAGSDTTTDQISALLDLNYICILTFRQLLQKEGALHKGHIFSPQLQVTISQPTSDSITLTNARGEGLGGNERY